MAGFEFDLAAIGRVLNETQATAAVKARADRAVALAKSTGRRNPRHRTHIVDQLGVGEPRIGRFGAEVDITTTSPWWHFTEFGTATQPPERTVTRSAQNVGLRVIDARSGG